MQVCLLVFLSDITLSGSTRFILELKWKTPKGLFNATVPNSITEHFYNLLLPRATQFHLAIHLKLQLQCPASVKIKFKRKVNILDVTANRI